MKPIDPKLRNLMAFARMEEINKLHKENAERLRQERVWVKQSEYQIDRNATFENLTLAQKEQVLEVFESLPQSFKDQVEQLVFEMRVERGEGFSSGWGNNPQTGFKFTYH